MRGTTTALTSTLCLAGLVLAAGLGLGLAPRQVSAEALGPPEIAALGFAEPAAPMALLVPARFATANLDLVPTLVTGDEAPELILAQRAIDRDLGKTPSTKTDDDSEYTEVEVDGWKSPAKATTMSFIVPGTGQLYGGKMRGYVYLGVEALAVYSYVHNKNLSDETKDQYYSYVGDPNVPSSRFSFERLEGNVSPEEMSRLRTIYNKDQREFYDLVSTDDKYTAGWYDPDLGVDGARDVAVSYSDDVDKYGNKSNFGLFTLIANHLVSAIDALNIARLNNIALKENLSMRVKIDPGSKREAYGIAFTQKFQ